MTINTIPTVDQARHDLEEAQIRLQLAEAADQFNNSFQVTGEVFIVVAKVPSFEQFVSYPDEGKLVRPFTSREEAQRFVDGAKKPVGYDYLIVPMPLYA